jgi:hypothetical protein
MDDDDYVMTPEEEAEYRRQRIAADEEEFIAFERNEKVLNRKRSGRLQGKTPGFAADNDCTGKSDPITNSDITVGMKLECDDNRCYDMTTIEQIKPSNSNDGHGVVRRSPFTRAPFTENDNAYLNAYLESKKAGGKKRKSRKSKKGKKSRKGGKSKKSRKSKKGRKGK